jgi:hypothetical protein
VLLASRRAGVGSCFFVIFIELNLIGIAVNPHIFSCILNATVPDGINSTSTQNSSLSMQMPDNYKPKVNPWTMGIACMVEIWYMKST